MLHVFLIVPVTFKVVEKVFHQVDRIKEEEHFGIDLERVFNADRCISSTKFFEELSIRLMTISKDRQNLKSNFVQFISNFHKMLQKTLPGESCDWNEADKVFI